MQKKKTLGVVFVFVPGFFFFLLGGVGTHGIGFFFYKGKSPDYIKQMFRSVA